MTFKAWLQDVHNDVFGAGLNSITCVAAQVDLLVYNKCMGAMEDSDIYDMAVGVYTISLLKQLNNLLILPCISCVPQS